MKALIFHLLLIVSNMNEQKFFTSDGREYVLKVQTRITNGFVIAAPTGSLPTVLVSPDPSFVITDFPNVIIFSTEKSIIPVQVNYAASTNLGVNLINVSSIYYNFSRTYVAGGVQNAEALPALMKSIPHGQQLFYTNDANYAYGIRYNQIFFSDADFIEPNGAVFTFHPTIDNAIISDLFAYVDNQFTYPAGTYDCTMTFLYFELQ